MNKNTYDISSTKRVTRKFQAVVMQNNGKEMYKKCQTYCCFFTVLFSFAAQHYTITYFVGANYKYYRELRFQPWLKLYIITERKETANSLIGICIVSSFICPFLLLAFFAVVLVEQWRDTVLWSPIQEFSPIKALLFVPNDEDHLPIIHQNR